MYSHYTCYYKHGSSSMYSCLISLLQFLLHARQAEETVVMKSFYWLIAYATWAQIIPYNWQPSEHLGGNHYNSMICLMLCSYYICKIMVVIVYSLLHSCSHTLHNIPCTTSYNYWIALRSYYLHSHEHAHKQPSHCSHLFWVRNVIKYV